MTLDDLMTELMALPISARSATVMIQTAKVDAEPVRILYAHGKVWIEAWHTPLDTDPDL